MARPERFELPTTWFEARFPNQQSRRVIGIASQKYFQLVQKNRSPDIAKKKLIWYGPAKMVLQSPQGGAC